jgi:hypothetical protein
MPGLQPLFPAVPLVAYRNPYIYPLFILFPSLENKINKGKEEGYREGLLRERQGIRAEGPA